MDQSKKQSNILFIRSGCHNAPMYCYAWGDHRCSVCGTRPETVRRLLPGWMKIGMIVAAIAIGIIAARTLPAIIVGRPIQYNPKEQYAWVSVNLQDITSSVEMANIQQYLAATYGQQCAAASGTLTNRLNNWTEVALGTFDGTETVVCTYPIGRTLSTSSPVSPQ